VCLIDAGVVNQNEVKVTLELRADGESLVGRATGPDGVAREFAGWIGLVGVIDALLADARGDGAGEKPSSG
jgi:hypothetical protein